MVPLLGLLKAPAARAGVFLSQDEALALAFPEADRIERRTYLLTDDQRERAQTLARAPLESALVTVHAGFRGDTLLGTAHIDVHRVRTLQEALMIMLGPDGDVRSVRMLAFYEPTDYLPPDRWRAQFDGRRLDDTLQLGSGIAAIAGSTLSARAATRSVRQALALQRVLGDTEPQAVEMVRGAAPASQESEVSSQADTAKPAVD